MQPLCGALTPHGDLRLSPSADGFYRVRLPDDADADADDLDHPVGPLRPIPAPQRPQPGLREIRVVVRRTVDGVEGGASDRGDTFDEDRDFVSNAALMQLVPEVTAVTPDAASRGLLRVTGARLWRAGAREAAAALRRGGRGRKGGDRTARPRHRLGRQEPERVYRAG